MIFDLIGGNIDTIDKDKLSYTYLLGLKFTQLNKKSLEIIKNHFRFKLKWKSYRWKFQKLLK